MSALGLGLGLSLGGRRIVGDAGNKPATFSIPAGFANAGAKRINFSEPVTVTMTGGVTLSIGSTQYQSGDTIPVATGEYHELTINNPGDAGTITFGKRKQITYLYLAGIGSSVITGDITGMNLTFLLLYSLGSSVITGKITGMKLTYLRLYAIGSSVITGDITGMELTALYLSNLGSSLTYGTNPLNITNNLGIQLLGNTVFSANEYIQLFADAATCVTDGKWTAATKILTISGGDNPGWSKVSTDYGTIVGGGVTVTVPLAWESGDDAFPSETFNPLSLDGTVFLIDCKAAEQQEYVREVGGEPAFWTKLLNLADPTNSAEYSAEADQAIYQPDGGFGWHAAHQNAIATPIEYRTVIIALKNNNPEYVATVTAISSFAGASKYNIAMASNGADIGYGNGCGMYQGTYGTRKITTDTRVGDGASIVLTIRNALAPTGTIRYNGVAQTLDDTGTNESTRFNGLPTSDVQSGYRWRGTIYGMYCNANVMSDADIAKVEAWMRKRYGI